MKTPKIDPAKKYRTRDGKEVRVYATDGAIPYSVHGATLNDGEWVDASWTAGGEYAAGSSNKRDIEVCMSLSDCQSCGGTIALGPRASNVCNKCGKGLWAPAEELPAEVTAERDKLAADYHPQLLRLIEAEKRADAMKAERDRWAQQHNTVRDESAASFERLSATLGGVGMTGYQPEIDMVINDHIKCLMAERDNLAAALRGLVENRDMSPVAIVPLWDAARAALAPAGNGEGGK